MAFLIMLVVIVVLIVYGVADSYAKTEGPKRHHKNHPPCKYQEEYLLASEFYKAYRQDSSRKDPEGDALFDARKKIWESGYLPSVIYYEGMDQFDEYPIRMRKPHEPIPYLTGRPRRRILNKCRQKDKDGLRGLYLAEYCTRVRKDLLYDYAGWKAYCDRMDEWFDKLGGVG